MRKSLSWMSIPILLLTLVIFALFSAHETRAQALDTDRLKV